MVTEKPGFGTEGREKSLKMFSKSKLGFSFLALRMLKVFSKAGFEHWKRQRDTGFKTGNGGNWFWL